MTGGAGVSVEKGGRTVSEKTPGRAVGWILAWARFGPVAFYFFFVLSFFLFLFSLFFCNFSKIDSNLFKAKQKIL
jgi:hypothetical protein